MAAITPSTNLKLLKNPNNLSEKDLKFLGQKRKNIGISDMGIENLKDNNLTINSLGSFSDTINQSIFPLSYSYF